MTEPNSPAVARHSRARAAGRGAFVAILVLLLGAGIGGYFFTRPRLAFANGLAGPVHLTVGTELPRRLAAGETASLTTPLGRTVIAVWELVRPLSAAGRPMGEEVRGSVLIPGARGTITGRATARGRDADYFAPLVSNATVEPLRLTVNAGFQGALDCGCAVRPGGQRVFIGYYRLYQNSNVRAAAGGGRTATFRDIGPSITAADGTIGLRFESKDLRPK